MKLSLTGSSSTGKTTLIDELAHGPDFVSLFGRFITTDGRRLLEELGHRSMDNMSTEETRRFQRLYCERKRDAEHEQDKFITDRSFIDVAAYWLVRDTKGLSRDVQEEIAAPCRNDNQKYDHIFYLPFGIVPFAADGYRSLDLAFHREVDSCIRHLLSEWNIRYTTLDMLDLVERARIIRSYAQSCGTGSGDD